MLVGALEMLVVVVMWHTSGHDMSKQGFTKFCNHHAKPSHLFTNIPEVSATETLCHCRNLCTLSLCELVCILLQDSCPAGLIWEPKVD